MATIQEAQKALAVLMAAYPSSDRMDRDSMRRFAELAVQALAPYHPSILDAMVNPQTGLATKCRFVPSIAEMVEFCERLAQRQWEQDRRERNRELQLTYRQEPGDHRREAVIRGFRSLLADLHANTSPLAGDRHQNLSQVEARAHAERWLEAHQNDPLPRLSDAAAATCGVVRNDKTA